MTAADMQLPQSSSLSMDLTEATPELFGALAKAQAQMQSVVKEGRNTDKKYDYATADAMIAGGSKAREGTGLALFSTWSSEDVDDPNQVGNQWVCAIVTLHWVLAHESGGYLRGTITGHAIGSKARPPDKAVAAAASYTEGFLERGLMRIDRGGQDAEDVDKRSDSGFERGRKPAPTVDNGQEQRNIHRGVSHLFAAGKWDDAAEDRALTALVKVDGNASQLRGWLERLREDKATADKAAQSRQERETEAVGRATGADGGAALAALSSAQDPKALLAAVREHAAGLLALPKDALGAAFLEHGERLGVDIRALDEALSDE